MRTQAADLAAGKKAQSTDDLDAIEEELENSACAVAAPEKRYGFLAVCAGDGLAEVFRDLGVDRIVSGGQTMNPSTDDILREVNRTPSEVVFVLPNNKNIIMAAQQCVGLSEKEVIVVPTATVPQGISAMMAVDPEDNDPQSILSAMTAAAEHVTTAQITYAARNSDFDGFAINEGDYLALCDGKLLGTDRSLDALLEKLAQVAADKDAEFITVYTGEGRGRGPGLSRPPPSSSAAAPARRSPPCPAASLCTTTSWPSSKQYGVRYERNDPKNRVLPAGHIHHAARAAELDILPPGAAVPRAAAPRASTRRTRFFRGTLVMVVLFSIATGLLLSLLVNLLHNRRLAQVLMLVVTALWTLLLCVEYCCRSYFKSYFSVGFICTMSGNVVTGFGSTIPGIVAQRLPFIIAALLPLALCILLRKRIVTEHRMSKWSLLFVTAVSVIFLLIGEGLARWGTYGDSYTYNFQTDAAVSQFGLHTAVRLEAEYALFGTPQPKLELPTQEDEPDDTPDDPPAATTPVEYGYNALDINFQALADSASDSALRSMAQYFGSLTPSKKNEYTGLFQGKNLVLITAEAFSPWFISRELTPTLYKLTHEGFVCENYYQPGWGQSTTGGEYAVMTGLLPTWVGSNVSFYASANDDMPFALGNQLRALGYRTGAYHDNIYNYYNRDKTHPNLGYDYQGVGNGLR